MLINSTNYVLRDKTGERKRTKNREGDPRILVALVRNAAVQAVVLSLASLGVIQSRANGSAEG